MRDIGNRKRKEIRMSVCKQKQNPYLLVELFVLFYIYSKNGSKFNLGSHPIGANP